MGLRYAHGCQVRARAVDALGAVAKPSKQEVLEALKNCAEARSTAALLQLFPLNRKLLIFHSKQL